MDKLRILSIFIERTRLAELAEKLESDSRLMILIGFLCVITLCLAACFFETNAEAAAFRVLWIVLTSLSLFILYRSGIFAANLSSSRSLLTIGTVCIQLICIPLAFSAQHALQLDLPSNFALLFLPWMSAPAITAILIGRRMGMFTTLAVSLLGVALCPPGDDTSSTPSVYLATSMISGVIAAYYCGRVNKRELILRAGFKVGLVVFLSTFLLGRLHQDILFQESINADWRWLSLELVVAVMMSFMYAVYIGGIMPVLERIFNINTPITWLELGDMNHTLLKQLQLQAPGTFHHSIVVSRLAESAAEAIGANPTRSAVCALFHDIGKLENPDFFAENINNEMGSPHDELTPDMSAKIIISHVNEGVKLASKYNLNNRIIDVIREHHGNSSAYFFYRKALDHYEVEMERFKNGKIDTEPKKVNIKDFSYKGSSPRTKESGIISMADAVESATRSIKNPTEDDIKEMIESIFKSRILDGHLNDSQLTLGDMDLMKKSFFISIKSMHHNRISYPKRPEQNEEEKTALCAE